MLNITNLCMRYLPISTTRELQNWGRYIKVLSDLHFTSLSFIICTGHPSIIHAQGLPLTVGRDSRDLLKEGIGGK